MTSPGKIVVPSVTFGPPNTISSLSEPFSSPPAKCSAERSTRSVAMIRMLEPCLVTNTHDVPGPTYKMWQTVDADPGEM
jgi:hypothetical protein